MSDCIFCQIARKEIETKLVHEDDYVVAFEDLNPKAPVHILAIPKEHIETVDDLNENHTTLVGRLVLTLKSLARERGLGDTGYRLVANCRESAGQSVWHLHFHLLGGRAMGWPPG